MFVKSFVKSLLTFDQNLKRSHLITIYQLYPQDDRPPIHLTSMTWHSMTCTYIHMPIPLSRRSGSSRRKGKKEKVRLESLHVYYGWNTSAKTGRQCTHALTWNVRSSPFHLILQKWGKWEKGNTTGSSSHLENAPPHSACRPDKNKGYPRKESFFLSCFHSTKDVLHRS